MSNTGGLPLTIPDLVCAEDLDPFGGETTSDLQTLIQDVMHIIEETPGSNPDDPQRGVGIRNYLSGSAPAFYKVSGIVEHQLTQDKRIDACSCTISTQNDPNFPFVLRIDISVDGSVLGLTLAYGSVQGLVNMTP